mgnify:CR=1 FL=1
MNLFFVFIYILLYELRNYINEKNNFDFNNVGKVYANIDKLTPQDKALFETFIETGKKSYLDIFFKLDFISFRSFFAATK